MALFDAFLKLDGIKGEGAGGEITLESFSWGVSHTGSAASGGGGGAGKAVFQDFSFSSTAGTESPELFYACASGKHIKTGELTITRSDSKSPLLTINFTDVLIASYKLDEHKGGTDSTIPMQQVSFDFAKFTFQSQGGVATGGPAA